jgi:hypothetical protein
VLVAGWFDGRSDVVVCIDQKCTNEKFSELLGRLTGEALERMVRVL